MTISTQTDLFVLPVAAGFSKKTLCGGGHAQKHDAQQCDKITPVCMICWYDDRHSIYQIYNHFFICQTFFARKIKKQRHPSFVD